MKSFRLSEVKTCLVLGGGDIGMALARVIKKRNPNTEIIITKRKIEYVSPKEREKFVLYPHDPLSEESWSSLSNTIKSNFGHLDLVISTYGILHDNELSPEKKIEDIALSGLVKAFQVNTFTAPLAVKHLLKLMPRESLSTFVFLSAKVGSISDNSTGGWYAYRASKASLNMMVKNMAIEFKNRKKNALAVAIHPGTTATELSRPYLSNFNLKVWEPNQTAEHILRVIDGLKPDNNGDFFNWDGTIIPY